MDLLPAELLATLPKIGATEKTPTKDKLAVVKFFDPCGRYTFYVIEGEPEGDDVLLFGYVVSPLGPDCDEWGYSSLNEIKSVRNRFQLGIERDINFTPKRVQELIK